MALQKELRRVKVLDSRKDKFTVYRSELVTQKQIKTFEEMCLPKAKFIDNFVSQKTSLIQETSREYT